MTGNPHLNLRCLQTQLYFYIFSFFLVCVIRVKQYIRVKIKVLLPLRRLHAKGFVTDSNMMLMFSPFSL